MVDPQVILNAVRDLLDIDTQGTTAASAAADAQAKATAAMEESYKRSVAQLEVQKGILENSENTLENRNALLAIETDIRKERLQLLSSKKQNNELNAEELAAYERMLKNVAGANEHLKEQGKLLEKNNKLQQNASSFAASIATKLGLAADAQQGLLRSALSAEGGPLKGLATAGSEVASSFGKMLSPTNIAVSMLEKFVEVTALAVLESDKLIAQFTAQTGEMGNVRSEFINLTLANKDLAIGFGEMMGAQLDLRAGFTDFVFLSDQSRQSLTLQSATMEKLGVDAGSTAQSLTMLTKAFGMSRDAAMETQREMIGLGEALGVPPAVIIQEFQAALPALAEFGDEAVDVFKRLQVASRQTGVSVSELTSVFGQQYDTFEGSTRIAAQLNRALGQDLVSSQQLLMADTEERVRIIQDALDSTGRSFEDLGRFESKFFAQAAGFDSVAQAAQIFGNTQEEAVQKIGNTDITMEQMEERARAATDSYTQLKFAMLSFAVALEPLTVKFAAMVDRFIELGESFPGGMSGLMTLIGVTAGGLALAGGGGLALAGGGLALGGLAMASPVGDAVISNGTVVPISSRDEVLAAQLSGPVMQSIVQAPAAQAQTATPAMSKEAAKSDTTLVVQVMLDNRQLGEAIVPYIDRRVLGTT
jgi:hypothetical protein